MSDGLRPYPDYKPAALHWLGQVPSHWNEKRAKYFFREADERSTTGEEQLMSVSHKTGVTPRKSNVTMFKAASNVGHKICRTGDLAINTLWAWMAALGVSKYTGLVSPAYGVYRQIDAINYDPEYLDFLLRTQAYAAEYRCRSTGITTSRLRLYPIDFLRIPLIQPPREEQTLIVNFLRQHDGLVRRFIRNRRRLIDTLNEQKQAIINQAVTRGLDPDVEMKPSGVEWLGEVPAHWNVRRLRNVADLRVSNVDKHTIDGELPVRLCNYTDVYKNSVITDDMPFMKATATADEIRAFRLQVGDVIITKDSEDWQDIGVPALVVQSADDLVCGYHLAILRPRPHVMIGRILAYAMQSRGVVVQLSLAANGVTRYGLSHGSIKAIVVPVPPAEEQESIARHIDEATAELNETIRCANREIDLIREYRTRLIADVVTGKLDVRHLAPDELAPEEVGFLDGDDEMDDELTDGPMEESEAELEEVIHADD